MKTLREQVQEIVEKKSSIRSKQIDLIKLGLTKSDIDVILSSIKIGKFDFSKLTFGVEIECYNCNRNQLQASVMIRVLTVSLRATITMIQSHIIRLYLILLFQVVTQTKLFHLYCKAEKV